MLWSFGLLVLIVDICHRSLPSHKTILSEANTKKGSVVTTSEIYLNPELSVKTPKPENLPPKLESANVSNILFPLQPLRSISITGRNLGLDRNVSFSTTSPKDFKLAITTSDRVPTESPSQTQRVPLPVSTGMDVEKPTSLNSLEATTASTEETWETNVHSIADFLHGLFNPRPPSNDTA